MLHAKNFAAVLRAARKGEDWAWTALYDELAPGLLGYLRARGAARPDDLLGEVMHQIARDLPSFGGGNWDFRSWAFTIAHHRVLDEERSSSRRPPLRGRPTPLADEHWAPSVERVGRLLALLDPDQHNVILLRVLGELTSDEIATVIGREPDAVEALEQQALDALRSELAKDALPEALADAELAGFLADVRATYLTELDEAEVSGQLGSITRAAEATHEQQRPEQDWWRRSIANRFVRPHLKP